MADDEPRAEIEAACSWPACGGDPCETCPYLWRAWKRRAERAEAALDRVRDARGDDEADETLFVRPAGTDDVIAVRAARSPQGDGGVLHEDADVGALGSGDLVAANLAIVSENASLRAENERLRAARSPQGEDHEAVEAILERIIDAASRVGADGTLPAETVRVECLRATYALSRVSPSRDGREGEGHDAGGRWLCQVDHSGEHMASCIYESSPSRDGTVAVEDVARRIIERLHEVRVEYRDATLHSDAAAIHRAINRIESEFLTEFSPASTGDRETPA